MSSSRSQRNLAGRPVLAATDRGGGWRSGETDSYRFVGRNLAACGALTVIAGYRLWPEVRFDGFTYEGAEADGKQNDFTCWGDELEAVE